MHEHSLYLQGGSTTGEIHRGLLHAAVNVPHDNFQAAVAYASLAGCQRLVTSFSERLRNWHKVTKRWLVSIDFGLTDPDALEFLTRLDRSEVRVPRAREVLAAALRPKVRFHNKLFLFSHSRRIDSMGLISGSANLTYSGLFLNNEQATGLIVVDAHGSIERQLLDRMVRVRIGLEQDFSAADPVTDSLAAEYREAWNRGRSASEDDNELVRRVSTPSRVAPLEMAAALALAGALWVEVGRVNENRGPGVPGNQIDLPRGIRVFFGFSTGEVPRNTLLGAVRIRFRDQVILRNMRFGNNYMEKLDLPIPGEGGPETYEYQTLLFRRSDDGSFEMELGTPATIRAWEERSQQFGRLFTMRGGRRYGIF